jgi:hypothetical protein
MILTVWGGPKKNINGVIFGWITSGMLGMGLMGLGRALPYWLAANFIIILIIPLVNGANQAIWQSKIAPEVQGRVFSVRRFIAQVTAPISRAVAGPLADQLFEPALQMPQTGFERQLSQVFGSGPGAGMSLIILLSGILMAVVSLVAYRVRAIRDVERLIPDHDEG